MGNKPSLETLVKDIRLIYSADTESAETLIEDYLQQRLKGLSADDRFSILTELRDQFRQLKREPADRDKSEGENRRVKGTESPERYLLTDNKKSYINQANTQAVSQATTEFGSNLDKNTLSRLSALLLHEGASKIDFSSEETLVKLAKALNTIFDKLNELMENIQEKLATSEEGLQTIRKIIGSEIKGDSQSLTLEDFLDQIKGTFFNVYEGFQVASHNKVKEILLELDPDRILSNVDMSLGFGPLKKAKAFELYSEKFNKFKKWFKSDSFRIELLREFEKSHLQIYNQKKGDL